MPPRTRKRKTSEDDLLDKQPQPSRPPPRKAQTTGAKKKASGSKVDKGRRESKLFLESAKPPKKPKLDAETAKRDIESRVDELAALVEDEPTSTLNAWELLQQSISGDLDRVLLTSNLGTYESTPSAVFRNCLQAVEQAEQSISKYKSIGQNNAALVRPNGTRWEQDRDDLKTLNQHALDLASRHVMSCIAPGPAKPTVAAPEEGHTLERVAWELLEEAMGEDLQEAWGTVVHGQLKAVEKLLRRP